MKKLLLLFIFILLGFIAKSQEYDEIYIRNQITLADSSAVAIETDGDTLATNISVRNEIHDSLSVFSASPWTDYGDSIEFLGKTITDTLIANENIGIGISNPLSALHINKGVGISNGFNLGSTLGNGFSLFGTDAVSGFVGNKEIFRLVENVTEQFIINPQGDLTGTSAAPSLAFGESGVFKTGLYLSTGNVLNVSINGSTRWNFDGGVLRGVNGNSPSITIANATSTAPNIRPSRADVTTGIGFAGTGQLSLIANFIEGVRVTEDTTFVKNYLKAEGGSNITGTSLTGVMQVAKAEVLYTNTIETTIITLPADAVIWNIGIEIVTIFDGTGTDLLNVGNTVNNDRWYLERDLSILTFILVDAGNNGTYTGGAAEKLTGSTNVTFTYTDQNSDATQGQGFIYIHYTTH